ncbi:MAG TPA: HDOD domain-containing protein [Terracidiphilus sp.]|nr:HDOD domain-containing protein [Terracidiphilus sp.]
MATHSVHGSSLNNIHSAQPGEQSFMARQPIMDAHNHVHGYELLFWNGREPVPTAGSDAATQAVLDGSLQQGLERLARGLPAFVPCTADSLAHNWLQMLPPQLTVIELPAGTEPTPSLLAACARLKEMGFWLAVDNFAGIATPLTSLADYVKIDFAANDAATRGVLLAKVRKPGTMLVARGVETREQFRSAAAEGFLLFQGYYFCHPEPLKGHRIPGNRLVHLEILELLQNDPFDLHRLSQLVTCDASLTYRLLRLVNSPLCAMRQEVTSIQAALMLVGQEAFRRIATLAIAGDFNADQPAELLRMAFVRGRFCELAAPLCHQPPAEQYLIGMVSLFPAMLQVSMEELVRMLPLRQKASDALRGRGNPEGALLDWIAAYEHGNWAACDALAAANNLVSADLMRCHADALTWAETSMASAA